MRITTRSAIVALVGSLALCLSLGACGSETGQVAQDPGPPTDLPVVAPPEEDVLVSSGLVTVLDDGDGAELCLGGVAESYPPQCRGPRLVGWDWSEHTGYFERASGVRWGSFAVTGTYDGADLTPTQVIPAALYDTFAPEEDTNSFATSCPIPDDAQPPDPSKVDRSDQDATLRAVERLEGYAGAWIDTSRDPRIPEQMDQDAAEGVAGDPANTIVNVRVVGDADRRAAAEAQLRETWGGLLCVSEAAYTEAELRAIQDELGSTPGMLSTGVVDQQVELGVVYDDGSLQAAVDERYGADVVAVRSELTPVEPG